MKLFAMLFLSLFLGKSCSSQTKNDLKTAIIEYTANSRGFFHKVTVQNQKVRVFKEKGDTGNNEGIKISNSDWKELVGYLESVKLDSLATLKAPTEKRFYDGAAIANLKIIYKGKTYGTPAFDHGFPPEAIKKLVDQINSFAKKQK